MGDCLFRAIELTCDEELGEEVIQESSFVAMKKGKREDEQAREEWMKEREEET